MNAVNAARAVLLAALGAAAHEVGASVEAVDACTNAAHVVLHEPGKRDLAWVYCIDGPLGAPDVESDPQDVERTRVVDASAKWKGAALDVSVTLADGRRVAADDLAVDAPPKRASGGDPGTTFEVRRAAQNYVRVYITDEPAREIVRRVAQVERIEVAGLDRLSDSARLTLHFGAIPVATALFFPAQESDVLLLQAHGDRYGFSTRAQAQAVMAARAEADATRADEDRTALEAALERVVAAAPVPAEGPVLDITYELDELARLHAARDDHAGAEALQRRRLTLVERIAGTRATPAGLASLDQIGTLRDLQGDAAGAAAMHREVVALADRVPDAEPAALAHSLGMLGFDALQKDDIANAERYFARASRLIATFSPDSLDALRLDTMLEAHAYTLELLGRAGEGIALQERRVAIARANFGDSEPMTAAALESVARTLVAGDQLPRAADVFGEALEIRARTDSPNERAEREAREVRAVVAALGEYARNDVRDGDVAALRRRLESDPLSRDASFRARMLLDRRAERQRGTPLLVATCNAFAELLRAGARDRSDAGPDMLDTVTDIERRRCLAGD